MREWVAKNQAWKGTASELAEKLQSLLKEVGLVDEGVPNERLVRNYTQLGILERPVRSGKEAYYGIRQIVEFLAARKLLADGWPLAKISEFTRLHEPDDLLDLLPEPHLATDAEKLVAKFKRTSGQPTQSVTPSATEPLDAKIPDVVLRYASGVSRSKSTARDTLRRLGNQTGEPLVIPLSKVTLTPWCELLFDPTRLKALPLDSLDALGEAIVQVLRDELLSLRRGPK
ncbi:hypothetical protein [Methyloterricola oryzae]|uniref:hypothetical protein n=1 Tax=Methyloterricola oryzae TaxID=1495050 RepID=UPI0005EB6585|nr:hypothetical protein [Methyloterricola oryzae]